MLFVNIGILVTFSLKSSDFIQVERESVPSTAIGIWGVVSVCDPHGRGVVWRGGELACVWGQILGDLWAGSVSPGLGAE